MCCSAGANLGNEGTGKREEKEGADLDLWSASKGSLPCALSRKAEARLVKGLPPPCLKGLPPPAPHP